VVDHTPGFQWSKVLFVECTVVGIPAPSCDPTTLPPGGSLVLTNALTVQVKSDEILIGTPGRFRRGKQIGSYLGLIPSEDSSGGRQRLGHISKQGNALLRFLLVEAAQAATRCNQQWRQRYWHLAMRREKSIAKVALGRQMAVRLYWMWRHGWDYAQLVEFGSHTGQLGTGHGVN
jgi:Transposase IS116/IS110/IS902 family